MRATAPPSCQIGKFVNGERIFITKTLGHEPIALEGVADGIWKLWFAKHPIGGMDERTMQATDLNDPPKGLPNTKTQAEQNLSKNEKPNLESETPPEPVTQREMN